MPVALELLAMAGSSLATIAYVAYRFGKLEGQILSKLQEHDRELGELKRGCPLLHGSLQLR